MKDWTLLAKVGGLDIPAGDLDRITPPLKALEDAFRPLTARLTPDIEPCSATFDEEDA